MKSCLLLLVCFVLVTPAAADERPVTAADYQHFIEGVYAKAAARARELQKRSFASRLEWSAAVAEILPDHMLPEKDAVLAELHITPAQMAAFIQAHPDAPIGPEVEAKLERALRPLMEKGQQLPALDDLDGALARAKQGRKPIMIFFNAEWCLPCKEMMQKPLRDQRVLTALRGYEIAIVDVTNEENKGVQAIKKQYAVESLPTLLVRQDGRDRLRLDHVVQAEELAAKLALPAQK